MKNILLSLIALSSFTFAANIHAVSAVTTGSADGTTEVCLGFVPTYVSVINETDNTVDVKVVGMDANKTVLTTGSTGAITYVETTNITLGSVTDASSVTCYGFQFTATSGDVLIYKANR